MALEVKTSYIGTNKDATELYIKDSTGLYGTYNLTGYGTPNIDPTDISGFIFTLANFTDAVNYKDTVEVKVDVIAGKELIITPTKLGATEANLKFEDGAYDLNQYVLLTQALAIATATAEASSVQLSTPITEDFYNSIDAIIDNNNNIYQIDKTVTFNADFIYVIEPLETGITAISGAVRNNLKFIITTKIDYLLGQLASQGTCKCPSNSKAMKVFYNKEMAKIAFDNSDYTTANLLISTAFNSYC